MGGKVFSIFSFLLFSVNFVTSAFSVLNHLIFVHEKPKAFNTECTEITENGRTRKSENYHYLVPVTLANGPYYLPPVT